MQFGLCIAKALLLVHRVVKAEQLTVMWEAKSHCIHGLEHNCRLFADKILEICHTWSVFVMPETNCSGLWDTKMTEKFVSLQATSQSCRAKITSESFMEMQELATTSWPPLPFPLQCPRLLLLLPTWQFDSLSWLHWLQEVDGVFGFSRPCFQIFQCVDRLAVLDPLVQREVDINGVCDFVWTNDNREGSCSMVDEACHLHNGIGAPATKFLAAVD